MSMIVSLLLAAATYQSSPARQDFKEPALQGPLAGYRAQLARGMMQDFGEKYIYASADAALPTPAQGEQRVVFIGDSITDRWDLERSFPGKAYVNRGIGGQVSAQMLVRFHQDVIALKPAAVVILAGINDLHGILQRENDAGIEANWEAMADMADAHGIKVVFGALLPVNNYTANAKDMLKERDPAHIRALNDWLRAFCARRGYGFADYHAVMVDRDGLLQRELTQDGIHPLAPGYARLVPVAQAAIDKALAAAGRGNGTR
jgi:lysophospholipase L1-like esterase